METLPAWFVVVMGMGTVFIGLFLIILLCKLLSFGFSSAPVKKESNKDPEKTASLPKEKRNEILAAVAVAIAEDSGKDPAGIRITSFKRIR